jgi:hypothetical protein
MCDTSRKSNGRAHTFGIVQRERTKVELGGRTMTFSKQHRMKEAASNSFIFYISILKNMVRDKEVASNVERV